MKNHPAIFKCLKGGGLFLLAAAMLLPPCARAGLTFVLDLYRDNQGQSYVFYTPMATNNLAPAAPLGTYVISSPGWPTNGSQRGFDLTASGLVDRYEFDSEYGYGDFDSAWQQITSGHWSILFTNATTTNYFTFTVSAAGVSSNVLPATVITSPTDGEYIPTNLPTFSWQGPSGWAVREDVQVHNDSYSFYQDTNLPASQNNWTVPVPLGTGYTFHLNYLTNFATPVFVASTPLNTSNAQPLSGWSSANILESGMDIGFTLFTPGPPTLGHTNLAFWTFDGNTLFAADVSGHGNNMNGYAWFTQPPYITNDAVFGPYAAGFAGGGWLTPPTNLVAALAGSFSVSLWVRTTNAPGTELGAADSGGGLLAANSDLTIPMALTGSELAFLTGGNPANTLHSATPINTGNYTHVVVTRDAGSGRKIIYINGVVDAANYGAPGRLTAADTPELFIGENTSFANDFVGDLDQIQIYSGVLSSNEVTYLHLNPGTNVADTTSQDVSVPLVASYDFEITNTPGADNSGHGNDSNCGSGNGGTNYDTYVTNAAFGSYARQFFGDTSICFAPGATCFNSLSNALSRSFSVSAWIKTTNTVDQDDANAYFGAPILFAYSSFSNSVIPLAITGSKAAFTVNDPTGADTTLHSTTTVNDGQYHFLTATRNQTNGVMNLYVDGSLNATAAGPTNPIILTSLIFLAGGYYVNYTGVLDDVRIYAGELNTNDVAILYGHPLFTLGGALNAQALTWTTMDGDTPWFVETTNTEDGVSAAQSGVVTNSQSSIISTTVTGPGTLTFFWSSQDAGGNFDYEFDIDNGYADDIFYNTAWYQDGPFNLSAGPHTLSWTVNANGDNDPTEAGFLDQVSFVPNAPVNLLNPQAVGANFQFSFQSQMGFTYAVQYATNLVAGGWQTFTTVTGDGTIVTVPVPLATFSPSKQGFIRVATQ